MEAHGQHPLFIAAGMTQMLLMVFSQDAKVMRIIDIPRLMVRRCPATNTTSRL